MLELETSYNHNIMYSSLIMQGYVVARVRMNKLDASAYRHAFEATFDEVKKQNPNFESERHSKEL